VALPYSALKVLAPYLRDAQILSLGYPDLTVTKEQIKKLFGIDVDGTTDGNIRHGLEHALPETVEFVEKLGSSLVAVDVTQERGETFADLNEPQSLGQFDLVIDSGTIEHCFNIGRAIKTAAESVKVGGVIFHLSPMTMINHGFYNICPTMYYDFYSQNGWTIKLLDAVPCDNKQTKMLARFNTHLEYMVRCLAKRNTDAEIIWPIQGKYLRK